MASAPIHPPAATFAGALAGLGPFLVVLAFLGLAAWAWPQAPVVGIASAAVGVAALPPSLRWLYRACR